MLIGIDPGTTNSAVTCTAALDSHAPRQIVHVAATLAALLDMLEANPPL